MYERVQSADRRWHATLVQEHHPRAECCQHGQLVLDEDRRAAWKNLLREQRDHRVGIARAQPARRLVEQEKTRRTGKSPRDFETPLLGERQLRRKGVRARRETRTLKHKADVFTIAAIDAGYVDLHGHRRKQTD